MHGGDILKFAGDAIIVCWSATRELDVKVYERWRCVGARVETRAYCRPAAQGLNGMYLR